jgi:hypothetical protein
MAEQVAYERRLADLDGRLMAHAPHAGIPNEVWFTQVTPGGRGIFRHG